MEEMVRDINYMRGVFSGAIHSMVELIRRINPTGFGIGDELRLPGGLDVAANIIDNEHRIGVRFMRGFDITVNNFISQFDVAAYRLPEQRQMEFNPRRRLRGAPWF